MARLWQSGFELNSTTTDVEFSNITTATIQTTTVRTGTYALRTNPAAATAFARYHVATSNLSTVAYQRVYVRIAALPGANATVMRFVDVANNACAQVRLTAAGTLVLMDAGSTPVGSASAALSLNTWYRLELGLDASTSPGSVEARLDGVSFASGANNIQSPWARVLVGPVVAATMDAVWDDWAVNDSSGSAQTSWPGAGQILHLVPTAAGDANAWNNTANAAGSTANFGLVDEVPPNDATDMVQTGTLNAEDSYNLANSGIGAGDTVNVVMVGLRFSNNTADAAAAVRAQIKKTSGGTIAQGSAIVPNTTTWSSNAPAQPRNYTLITYADPDGAAWTQGTLDSAQAGVKLTAAGTQRVRVTAVWVSVDYTPSAGGSTQPANPALETDAAQALGRVKTSAAAPASETDTAQALGRVKTRAASPATEVDTAQTLGRSKARPAATASEVDAAQPLARRKTRALGIAAATEAAQPFGRRKTRALGAALEIDAAQALGMAGGPAFSPAAEVDAAQPLGKGKALAVAPSITVETARPFGRMKSRTLGPAVETAVALTFGRRKVLALVAASETDAAQALGGGAAVSLRGTASAGEQAAACASAGAGAAPYASAGVQQVPTASGGV